MGLFTTLREFQKQPAISDVKRSRSCVCVSARISANHLLTSCSHEQNLYHLLVLFVSDVHSPVQETGFKYLYVKYISIKNKAQRENRRKPPRVCVQRKGVLLRMRKNVTHKTSVPPSHAWEGGVRALFVRSGCHVPMILEQGQSPGLWNWKEMKEGIWGSPRTAPNNRKGHSGNVTLPRDCKSHRGEALG